MSKVNYSRLSNLGNTCYQNAVLHPLIHTPGGFTEFIMSGDYLDCMAGKSDEAIYNTLIFQYHRILNSIFKDDNCELNVNSWKSLVGKKIPFFSGFDQQDSQEFLSCIIDKMSDEVGQNLKLIPTRKIDISKLDLSSKILNIKADCRWEKFHKKKYSIMVPFFCGMFRTRLVYLDSKAEANSFTPFNIIPLSIPKNISNVKLADCLEELSKDEELDKDNRIKGKLSYGKTYAIKQESIWKLPKYLIFNLKRFICNDYGQITRKDTTLVNYPLEIDMSKYINKDSKYSKINNKYYLYGVTLHHGVMMGGFSAGHYVSFVKNRTDKKWYLYNDDNKPMKIKEKNLVNSNAYLLFYARKD